MRLLVSQVEHSKLGYHYFYLSSKIVISDTQYTKFSLSIPTISIFVFYISIFDTWYVLQAVPHCVPTVGIIDSRPCAEG
eukprot:SAG31_NODE_4950_length_2840_cov_2.352061_2_plen_79_part_00